MLGHRGLTHGLFVAALTAVVVAFVWFRELSGTRAFRTVLGFLFFAAASHGLLDAATGGDIGVALFAPLTNARVSFPFKLVASCPGGIDEMFGYWGIMTVANEILYVVFPLKLLVDWVRFADIRRRLAVVIAAWAVCVVVLRAWRPDAFRPTAPRPLLPIDTKLAGKLADIPTDGLPDGKLVTRLADLRARGLFDKRLVPHNEDVVVDVLSEVVRERRGALDRSAAPKLVWRTLFGFSPVDANQARAWLAAAKAGDATADRALFRFVADGEGRPRARALRLSRADAVARAQREHAPEAALLERALQRRRDGVALRARAVPRGRRHRRGRLARALPSERREGAARAVVRRAAHDDRDRRRLRPHGVRRGRDVQHEPGCALDRGAQPHRARGYVVSRRRAADDRQAVLCRRRRARARRGRAASDGQDASVARARWKIASLVDVAIELDLSSTTLPYAAANVLASRGDPTRYRRVGLVPVVKKYEATLALDGSGELIGGRWRGNPADGPDDILVVGGGPTLTASGDLDNADTVPWWFVQALAHASVDDASPTPTVDLRKR